MKALLQRVSRASVDIDGKCAGSIGPGLLVLLGLDKADDTAIADTMLDKLLAYRVFADSTGKMNLSVADVAGGILLVSQKPPSLFWFSIIPFDRRNMAFFISIFR